MTENEACSSEFSMISDHLNIFQYRWVIKYESQPKFDFQLNYENLSMN